MDNRRVCDDEVIKETGYSLTCLKLLTKHHWVATCTFLTASLESIMLAETNTYFVSKR